MCSHIASWEFDFACGPCLLLCFVHGLLYLGRDKVVCQTQGKTNKPDSGSIYILLCNSLDLFLPAFVGLLLRITTRQLILLCGSALFRTSEEYLPHCRCCCIKRLINNFPHQLSSHGDTKVTLVLADCVSRPNQLNVFG